MDEEGFNVLLKRRVYRELLNRSTTSPNEFFTFSGIITLMFYSFLSPGGLGTRRFLLVLPNETYVRQFVVNICPESGIRSLDSTSCKGAQCVTSRVSLFIFSFSE